MERPILRMCYKHFKGGFYVIHGFAEEEKGGAEVVIYSSLENGKVYTRPLADFFAKHPETQQPRFELVKPS
jgi:hypothetical protein